MINAQRLDEEAVSRSTISTNYVGRPLLQWFLVVVLTFAAMLGAIDRQIMSLLLVPIKIDLHLTDTALSLLYGLAFSLANVIFLIPAGYVADRFNRRNILLVGIAVWSIMTAACGFGTNYIIMFFARAGVGFGEAVIQPTGVSMLRSAIPHERRGRAFAVYAMALMLGTALALLLGGWLIHMIQGGGVSKLPVLGAIKPWQAVLVLLGLLGIPLFALVLLIREPTRGISAAPASSSYRETLHYLHHNRAIFYPLFFFNTAAGMISLGFGAWVVPMLLRVWHLTIPQVGMTLGLLMVVCPPIGLAIVGTLMDRLSRRFGARGPIMVGLGAIFIITIVTISAPLASSLPVFWILLTGVMLTSSACFPIASTLAAAIAPVEKLGRITSIQYILYGIFAGALSATVIALVSDGFFAGPRAIANALSLMCAIYGVASFSAGLLVLRALSKPATP